MGGLLLHRNVAREKVALIMRNSLHCGRFSKRPQKRSAEKTAIPSIRSHAEQDVTCDSISADAK